METRLDELNQRMQTHMLRAIQPLSHLSSLSSFNEERRELGNDIRELKHIADLLGKRSAAAQREARDDDSIGRVARINAKMAGLDSLYASATAAMTSSTGGSTKTSDEGLYEAEC